MRRFFIFTAFLSTSAIMATLLHSCGGSGGGAAQAQTAFERLGGEQGIRKVVDDAVPCLATSQQIGIYFRGLSGDSLERIKVCLVKQLCAASGGPCQFPTTITYTSPTDNKQKQYTCRDMRAAHQGMLGDDLKGIDNADFDEFNRCVQRSMQQNNVPQDLQRAVLNILESQRNDVVDDRQKGR